MQRIWAQPLLISFWEIVWHCEWVRENQREFTHKRWKQNVFNGTIQNSLQIFHNVPSSSNKQTVALLVKKKVKETKWLTFWLTPRWSCNLIIKSTEAMFFFMSVHSKAILGTPPPPPPISKLYKLTHSTVNNQFNNRSYNISIIQNISYIVTSIKVIPIFLKFLMLTFPIWLSVMG